MPSRSLCLLFALAAGTLDAAVIRGMVVENQTGKPLQRATVTIQPLPGAGAQSATLRTNRFGAFESPSLPGGAYVMTISRAGFLTMQYGQKEWKSAGYPIFVQDDEATFLNVRLWRLGAVSGTVVDEDDIGLPDQDVIAYRNTRPPQLVTRGKTDDRGTFRIGGLLPGSYLVRSGGRQYDEDGYLPTFHRETGEADQAMPAEVRIEEETRNIHVRARPGRLVTISGGALPCDPPAPISVTLASDMGRQFQHSAGFRFANLVPGRYELYGQSPAAPPGIAPCGALLTIPADRDTDKVLLQLLPLRPVGFQFQGVKGERFNASKVQMLARRKDAAGADEPFALKIVNNTASLTPGRWEFAIVPNPEFYVAGFSDNRYNPDATARPEGWNETLIRGTYDSLRFTISNQPAAIRGVVTTTAHEPVIGAPVFLEPYDIDPQKRIINLHETRTDTRGQYRFAGIPPGAYRLLSTFEYNQPDAAAMDIARAKSVKLEAGRELQIDLDLYGIR